METNLLRLTDKYDDPVEELRLAATAVRLATRRVLERAIDNGPLGEVARAIFKPRVRTAEDASTLVVTVEVPGADRNSLEVTLSKRDILCIKGRGLKKPRKSVSKDVDSPPQARSFERTLPLSGQSLEREKATAHFDNGILTVTIPKLAKTLPAGSTEKSGARAA